MAKRNRPQTPSQSEANLEQNDIKRKLAEEAAAKEAAANENKLRVSKLHSVMSEATSDLDTSSRKAETGAQIMLYGICYAVSIGVIDVRLVHAVATGLKEARQQARHEIGVKAFGYNLDGDKKEAAKYRKYFTTIYKVCNVASVIMADYRGGDLDAYCIRIDGKRMVRVPGSLVLEKDHPDYGGMIALSGERGRAFADVVRKARTILHPKSETTGANESHQDLKEKQLGTALNGSLTATLDVVGSHLATLYADKEPSQETKDSLGELRSLIGGIVGETEKTPETLSAYDYFAYALRAFEHPGSLDSATLELAEQLYNRMRAVFAATKSSERKAA